MGEAAEDILDGSCCQYCGEWFHGEDAPGFPRSCAGCGGETVKGDGSGKRARRKRAKARRAQRNRDRLAAAIPALDGWDRLSPHHFRKIVSGVRVDLWPSTEKYSLNGGAVFFGGADDAVEAAGKLSEELRGRS